MGLFDQGVGNRNGLSPAAVALLGLLAVKGFENRDKLAGMLGGALGGDRADPNAPGDGNGRAGQPDQAGGIGGMLGGLADAMGGGRTGQPGQQQGLGGLLGGLAGALGGKASTGTVMSNGLGDVVKRFEDTGNGDVAHSWVDTGPNQEPAPQQIEQAVGSDLITQLAQQTGQTREEILARLTRDLPKVVDQFTPQGHVPTESEVNSTLSGRA